MMRAKEVDGVGPTALVAREVARRGAAGALSAVRPGAQRTGPRDRHGRRHADSAMVRPVAGVSKSTSGCSSPAARSKSCSTTRPSDSNAPWPSRWSSGGASSWWSSSDARCPTCPATCSSPIPSCACSPLSPAHVRCRHRRASATPSVWSDASAGGSDAHGARAGASRRAARGSRPRRPPAPRSL